MFYYNATISLIDKEKQEIKMIFKSRNFTISVENASTILWWMVNNSKNLMFGLRKFLLNLSTRFLNDENVFRGRGDKNNYKF